MVSREGRTCCGFWLLSVLFLLSSPGLVQAVSVVSFYPEAIWIVPGHLSIVHTIQLNAVDHQRAGVWSLILPNTKSAVHTIEEPSILSG